MEESLHKKDKNSFAWAGGGEMKGGMIAGIQFFNRALTIEECQEMNKNAQLENDHDFPLHEYEASGEIFYKGVLIQRHHVIKYVANKLGGAHLDFARAKDQEAFILMDELSKNFVVGGLFKKDSEFEEGKTPPYASIMSIAQHICKSPDVIKLKGLCEEFLNRS